MQLNFTRKHRLQVLCASILMICSLNQSRAQTNKPLRPLDTANINAAARASLDGFKALLNNLCDSSYNIAEKDRFMDGAFSGPHQVFQNKQVVIDNDLDPAIHEAGKGDMYIDKYLNSFKISFFPEVIRSGEISDGKSPVEFYIEDISRIKKKPEDGFYFVRVRYNELFNGKNDKGVNYGRNERMATIIVVKQSVEWIANISAITFDKIIIDNGLNVPIDEGNFTPNSSAANKSNAYYENLMRKGNDANYIDAYAYFAEARESKNFRAEAANKIEELKEKMRSLSITDANSAWAAGLKKRGDELSQNHKYAEAKNYYIYAHGLSPMDNSLQSKIDALEVKLEAQAKLEALYNNAAFDQAQDGYKDAISKDPNNSDLYIGLAKCYEHTSAGTEGADKVMENFDKAIALDSTNADIYLALSEYYEGKRDNTKAYNTYGIYVKNIDISDRNSDIINKLESLRRESVLFETQKKSDHLKELGSVLQASNITMQPKKPKHKGKREKKTSKAHKANELHIYFDTYPNRIADDGKKEFYISVIGPKGNVLPDINNSNNSITTTKNEEVKYTIHTEAVLKQGEPLENIEAVYSWADKKKHKKGLYWIRIYSPVNGHFYEIGHASVWLK